MMGLSPSMRSISILVLLINLPTHKMEFQVVHLTYWLKAIFAMLSTYVVSLVFYRVFFHPLANYPGPFLAKVSNAYMLYYAWKGERHIEFWRLHEKYGNAVRFAPNSLSFNSNSALKEIYGFRANVRKSEFYDAFVHPAPNTHNTREKDIHARKRRVLSQAFSDGAIKEMERYILANIRIFCDEIGCDASHSFASSQEWSSPRNMADWCNYLAMDILGDLCFGKAFRMLECPYAINLVGIAAQRHLLCGTMPIIDRLGLDKVLFHRISEGRAKYMEYSRAQLGIRTKLGDEADRRDFFYHLLKSPRSRDGGRVHIIAGSDTTSTAMAATLFYLTRNTMVLARVTREVRSVFSTVEDIRQGSQLTGCTYLRACIDEAMRLSPSVGGLLPREVLAGGIQIGTDLIPEGTVIGTPHYAIHHNTEYFPEPFSYLPERWAKVSTEEEVSRAQSAFCPFSIGPRGCIGKGLAYVEMTTALARVLFLYDMQRAVGIVDPGEGNPHAAWGRHRPEEFQLVDTFTSLKNGPMIEFRARMHTS
ncbi:benzoate 4-monooxygenase cytochrome p450 [Grosmannia clavigera kw1407]|uniref:Benzoate 4-monooxygenase cytochrome p450 n=1 Tax=Grosmannia clavigera (strain kw1407 / UAMH 11150) TaxID=655863 RepID=F0XG45_GROCL|nr:benzoate 4-monooxygenase cytochrome p450 [Grosmannia clavigera kw1407]EFX03415.1 benzoate 4-monooxygenase cytochrome p450 [Grosmannia clavigera kw1407]